MALLLAGGQEDPNLAVLADAARTSGVDLIDLRMPAGESLAFCWNPEEGSPRLAGVQVLATSAFIRQDVFAGMRDPRPAVNLRAIAWYQAIMGWLLSQPQIRIFNRKISQVASNKPAVLVAARQAGLPVPPTWVTNQTEEFSGSSAEQLVAKPVAGGDYCYSLADALAKADLRGGLAAMPAMVQKRMVAPEVRIYVIGQFALAFEVRSSSLDYRVKQDAELVMLPEVPRELALLRCLMLQLGMDFGAADFKTDPDSGELVFLELNTSPMFARFDQVSGGRLSAAMISELIATT